MQAPREKKKKKATTTTTHTYTRMASASAFHRFTPLSYYEDPRVTCTLMKRMKHTCRMKNDVNWGSIPSWSFLHLDLYSYCSHHLLIICSFNNNTLQKRANGKAFNFMTSAQHNLRLVVSERYLHFSVTKFQDKSASLRQVNSPYSWNKFQICCTDMYLIGFLLNFGVFLSVFVNFSDLPEFHGSVTMRNIRSPVLEFELPFII